MNYDVTLNRYYNREEELETYGDYKVLLFRAGDALQSAELNEIQSVLHDENVKLASNYLNNGQIISGGTVQITSTVVGNDGEDRYDNEITTSDSVIYLGTYYVNVPGSSLFMNNLHMRDVNNDLGIKITYTEVTESDDASLKDPAVETRNYKQPGAARLQVTGEWIFFEDYVEYSHTEYVSLFEIKEGELIDKIGDSVVKKDIINLIAKYDRNSNGNYVIEGYEVSYLSKTSDLGP